MWQVALFIISMEGFPTVSHHEDAQRQDHQQMEKVEEKPQPTILLLIRHATNDWVGTERLAGWTPGIHLNEEGRRQAQALAERLAKQKIAAIYSSPLERTVETAEILAKPHGLPIRIRDGLGEVHFGDWTGQFVKELAEKQADLWRMVQMIPSQARFPNGESLYEMQVRAVRELDAIVRAHPGQIVAVVSHADVIKACLAHYLGIHLDLFQRLVISPASLTVVQVFPMGVLVSCVNDTSHVPEEQKVEEAQKSAS